MRAHSHRLAQKLHCHISTGFSSVSQPPTTFRDHTEIGALSSAAQSRGKKRAAAAAHQSLRCPCAPCVTKGNFGQVQEVTESKIKSKIKSYDCTFCIKLLVAYAEKQGQEATKPYIVSQDPSTTRRNSLKLAT
eukprot:jgi/Ulvmu1/11911/UM081_0071.1